MISFILFWPTWTLSYDLENLRSQWRERNLNDAGTCTFFLSCFVYGKNSDRFEGVHVHTCSAQFLVSILCHQPSYQFSLSPTKPEVTASFSYIDSDPIIHHSLPLTTVVPSQRINKCIRDFHLLCHLCRISEEATGGVTLSTFTHILFKDTPDVPSCGHFCFIRKPLQQLLVEERKPQRQLFDINL